MEGVINLNMHSIYYSSFPLAMDYLEDPYLSSSCPFPKRQPREVDFRVKYKTEICRNWELGSCEFGHSCAFAHGQDELRGKANMGSNYKTKKCKQFHEQGYCIYGNRCQFRHKDPSTETSPSPISSMNTSRKSSDDNNRKRLQIFIDIQKKGECFPII
ncbi:hypothetical protein SteCoe_1662 [Stentor coeruleus]|uniref:C3H1-type domain-containing protein n=1 Tax=Stentor coeruleus TaxID=5963 RepID=A0A1R2D1H4_9CILI|nr:hypothetical protein SteCoe_1662 [Stentor coeruleus]